MSYTERETWITMNDGVKLDASIFTPKGEQPQGGWPGVLLIHGHGDAGNKTAMFDRARHCVGRGYLTVSYSVRGQGDSEGLVFHMGARELFDLQDVISWVLRALPIHWEKLGVCGSSQGGWHAYMAAAHHPQVATVVPENIFVDYADFAVHNGCLSKWFFTRTMRRRILTAGLQEVTRQWAVSGDWFRIREWVKPMSPSLFVDRIQCPIFILHGWHDVGMPPNQIFDMFARIQSPKKLYVGGGGHDGQDSAAARKVRTDLIDRWLDHWLKGEDTGIMDEPAMVYVRRPGWDVIAVDAFPPADVETRILYLSAVEPERAVPDDPDAAVEGVRPQPVRALVERASDVPRIHSNITNRPINLNYGLADALNDDMAGVADALAHEEIGFASAPVDGAVEIVGAPVVKLYVMPNRPQFQVVLDLCDVNAKGERTSITRGQFGTRTATPGQHLTVEIEMRAIAYAVAAGHRLLLNVCNCDTTYAFPYFEPFVVRVFHDKQHPSAVALPLRNAEPQMDGFVV